MTVGRHEEALAEYRRSLAIADKLAAADPGNTGWQRDLSVSHNKIGDLLMTAGRREEALAEYRMGLEIAEKLVAADPGNTGWQADLVISCYKVSRVSEPAAARAALLRAITVADMLAKNGRLTEAQTGWPQLLRDALAKLLPEPAGAQ
jgi:tetratricopeptide (TPR) repeat protein